MEKRARLILKYGKEKSLSRRHPWVFSGAVQRTEGCPKEGELAAKQGELAAKEGELAAAKAEVSAAKASEAKYEGLRTVCGDWADRKISYPHTWHAAEMFLYLTEQYGN